MQVMDRIDNHSQRCSQAAQQHVATIHFSKIATLSPLRLRYHPFFGATFYTLGMKVICWPGEELKFHHWKQSCFQKWVFSHVH